MKAGRGRLTLCMPLLLAAAAPLLASDFNTYGCPAGPPQQLNGFTAGSQAPALICLVAPANTFAIGGQYTITLRDTLLGTLYTVGNIAPQADTLILVTVPNSFYASVANPGQPDPVNVAAEFQSNQHPPALTSTFQINPPMAGGGPVFISAVNSPVSWTMYTGGTGPYESEFSQGQVPDGMPNFPSLSPIWPGTPNETGIFTFSLIGTDSWGNAVSPVLTAYIVPSPAVDNANPVQAAVGSGTIPVTINGSNFVGPVSIPEPGSTVQAVFGSNPPVVLTPTSFSANQLTVNIPANLLTSEGYLLLTVNNLGVATSAAISFPVNPTITALSTYTRTAGAQPFTLGVTGAGFTKGARVMLNGQPLPTAFLNGNSLAATFPTILVLPAIESITVVNPDGTTSAPQIVSIVPAPNATSLLPASVNAGSAGFPLTVTGSNFQNTMTVYFNNSPLPTTLVQNQKSNQLVANVPASAVAASGIALVTVGTVDGYYTPNLPFQILSTGPPPLQLLTFSPLPGGVVNTAYSTTFTASQGAPGYTFSVTSGALPAGLLLSAAGVLSGIPTAIGSSQFIVQVADSAGNTVARNFTLGIAPQPLTFTTGPLANTLVNTALNVQFAASGGIPPYTFVEFGALPPGTSISSAGLLSGTPTRAGAYPFLVFVDDSTQAFVSKSFTLNIALPGLLISTPSPLPSGQVNQPYTTQLAATGGVGPPYVWYATGLPQGLTMASNSGLIAGIPRATGSFTVGVTAGDSSGATVTQNYTLVIASTNVTVTTNALPNGAVGNSYSATLTAVGGSGTYTFTATGLPPGLTLAPAGTVSGTPTTTGAYTIAATATDSNGLTGSASFNVTIAATLVVTPATIANAIVGVAISPVQLAATGGTPPYRWQSATLPPGLSVAVNGTISGTPAAAGTFTSTVFVVDTSGTLASGTVKATVGLPTALAASITGLPATTAAAVQPSLGVSLSSPYPAAITVNLTLTFTPVSGAGDPSIQFSTGGRTAQIVIPAGETAGLTNVGVQTGTVAGTITITAQLLAGTVNVTPTPAPTQTIVVTPGPPVITRVTAVRTNNGFTVTVTGYASNRDVDTGTYLFSASEGSTLQTTQLSTSDTSLFTQWYGSSGAASYGSQFTLTQQFTVSGSTSSILSVTVTLTNALGTSPAATAILQ